MARPRMFPNEALLESIRESFLELGPAATTQELAARAGVSEGTLFKRFDSKPRMFALAMRLPPLEGPWFDDMVAQAGSTPLGSRLEEIALGISAYLQELLPRLMCAFGRPLQPEHIRLIFGDEDAPSLVILRRLTRMFEIEIADGRVRPLPARHLAELFLGALQHHVHATVVFGPQAMSEPDLPTFARELAATVDALLKPPARAQG